MTCEERRSVWSLLLLVLSILLLLVSFVYGAIGGALYGTTAAFAIIAPAAGLFGFAYAKRNARPIGLSILWGLAATLLIVAIVPPMFKGAFEADRPEEANAQFEVVSWNWRSDPDHAETDR